MIRFALAFLLAAATAQQAAALSCVRPTVERSFAQAQSASEDYLVVLGQLDFQPASPPSDGPASRQSISVPARIEGRALTSDGFSEDIAQDVIVDLNCMGPYCGQLEPGAKGIAFLRRGADNWTLQMNPCPQWFFPDPSRAQRQAITACFATRACTAE